MRPLSASELLDVWESGERQHPIDRAMTLLAAASPERTWEELVSLSVGQRDALLLRLREITFGPSLECFAACLQCGERLEFTMDVPGILAAHSEEQIGQDIAVEVNEYTVVLRLPNSLDLAAIAAYNDVEMARDEIVRRCVLRASRDEIKMAVEELPHEVVEPVVAHMAELDPLSEVRFDVQCSECGHNWPIFFDIVSYFWAEIAAQARRLMHEVHTLARAYAWHETDILAMSARRRRNYLSMVS